jgi:hypothetical protein
MLVNGLSEVAIVGAPANEQTGELLKVVQQPYRPNVITALASDDVPGEAIVPLLGYRTQRNSQPTVFICRHFACKMPVTTPEEVRELLKVTVLPTL